MMRCHIDVVGRYMSTRRGRYMIIIEGMDVTGKSTLARLVANRLHYRVKESEGPPKSREEINERVRRYAELSQTVVVRHPVISNAIYSEARGAPDEIDPAERDDFYRRRNLLVYCDPSWRGRSAEHILKDHDTPGHLRMLETKGILILSLYRRWALQHAHVIYRIGDDQESLVRLINAHLY